jgi:hypothetical protein
MGNPLRNAGNQYRHPRDAGLLPDRGGGDRLQRHRLCAWRALLLCRAGRKRAGTGIRPIYGVFGGIKYRNINQQGAPVDEKGEDFASLAAGVGFTWMYGGGAGFDFDVLYVDNSSARDRARELRDEGDLINRVGAERISIGVGYRMRFD